MAVKRVCCIFAVVVIVLCAAGCVPTPDVSPSPTEPPEIRESTLENAQSAVDAADEYLDGDITYADVLSAVSDNMLAVLGDESGTTSDSKVLDEILNLMDALTYSGDRDRGSMLDVLNARDALAELVDAPSRAAVDVGKVIDAFSD